MRSWFFKISYQVPIFKALKTPFWLSNASKICSVPLFPRIFHPTTNINEVVEYMNSNSNTVVAIEQSYRCVSCKIKQDVTSLFYYARPVVYIKISFFQNYPLCILTTSRTAELKFHYIVHTCLDVIEEKGESAFQFECTQLWNTTNWRK